MNKELKYCVYEHRNKANNKVYVGMTSQVPNQRWRSGSNYYGNTHFHRAIQKYGWSEGFEHIIVKDNLTKEDAESLEIELIKKYDSTNQKLGYNIEHGGSCHGKHSEQTLIKMSESQKGELNHMYGVRGEMNPQSKAVVCLNDGSRYGSVVEAFASTGISNIGNCCNRKQLFAGKNSNGEELFWLFESEYEKMSDEELLNRLSELTSLTPRYKKNKEKEEKICLAENRNAIFCLNDNKKFKNLREASLEYGISDSSISMNVTGKREYCFSKKLNGIYLFKKLIDYKKLEQSELDNLLSIYTEKHKREGINSPRKKSVICLDDNNVFITAKECGKYYGIDSSYICMVCKGKLTHAKGKHFEYMEYQVQEMERVVI